MFFSHFSPMLSAFPRGKRSPENIRNPLPLTRLAVRFPTGLFAHPTPESNWMIQASTKGSVFVTPLPQSTRAFLMLTNQTPANYAAALTRNTVED